MPVYSLSGPPVCSRSVRLIGRALRELGGVGLPCQLTWPTSTGATVGVGLRVGLFVGVTVTVGVKVGLFVAVAVGVFVRVGVEVAATPQGCRGEALFRGVIGLLVAKSGPLL